MYVHTGSVWGYRAMLSWYPDADLGIFLSFTGNDPNYLYRLSLHNYIFDVYKEFKPYLNSSTICSFPEPWINIDSSKQKPNHSEKLDLHRKKEEYLGTYHNDAYGSLEVKGHQDASKLTMVYGYTSFLLYPSPTKDVFYGESTGISRYLFDVQKFKFSFDTDKVFLQTLDFGSKPIFNKQTGTNAMYVYNGSKIIIVILIFVGFIFK